MGQIPRRKIDRYTISYNTHSRAERVRQAVSYAKQLTEDTDRDKRHDAAECVVCYLSGHVGGAMCTSTECALCGEPIHSGNTCVAILCVLCAKANGLCKHCGADIDLKMRKKPRPFELSREGEAGK